MALGEAVEGEPAGEAPELLSQRDHLVEVRPRQGEHDVRFQARTARVGKEIHHQVEMAAPADEVIVLAQAFEADLVIHGPVGAQQRVDGLGGNGIPEDRGGDGGIGDRAIQIPEMGVVQGIAAGEA